jgi:hypothetical protein
MDFSIGRRRFLNSSIGILGSLVLGKNVVTGRAYSALLPSPETDMKSVDWGELLEKPLQIKRTNGSLFLEFVGGSIRSVMRNFDVKQSVAMISFEAVIRTHGVYCNDLGIEVEFWRVKNRSASLVRKWEILNLSVPCIPAGQIVHVGDTVQISDYAHLYTTAYNWRIQEPGNWTRCKVDD